VKQKGGKYRNSWSGGGGGRGNNVKWRESSMRETCVNAGGVANGG
jgi:hypothetical protein